MIEEINRLGSNIERAFVGKPDVVRMTLVGLFGVYAVMRRSVWAYTALGFTLSLLVLTKVIFAPFWIPLAAIIIVDGWKSLTAKRLALVLAVFVVSANALPLAWMARNALVGGDFKLVEWFGEDRVELYDLSRDTGEYHDVGPARPERRAELRGRLRAWREDIDARLPVPNPDWSPPAPADGS